MWGKTISGWVRISYYHPEGTSGAILGRKTVQHQSNWRWGEGTAGKGTGSKTENIIILLYKSMVPMCLECCLQLVPQRGCSRMRKSVAVLAGVLQGDRGFGWEWEAGTELGAATGWNFEEPLVRRDKHWGNRYEMTPLWRDSNQALHLEKVTAGGATLEIGQVMMCTEMWLRNGHSLFITAWELGGQGTKLLWKSLKEREKNSFFTNAWPNLELVTTGHKSVTCLQMSSKGLEKLWK